jgi:outer membrane protein
LSAEQLGLAVQRYDPAHHYIQVRDKWGGLRTPDGR